MVNDSQIISAPPKVCASAPTKEEIVWILSQIVEMPLDFPPRARGAGLQVDDESGVGRLQGGGGVGDERGGGLLRLLR